MLGLEGNDIAQDGECLSTHNALHRTLGSERSVICAMIISSKSAHSKHGHSVSHVYETAASAQSSTGPARGAARRMVCEVILGNAGAAATAGAVVSTARCANSRQYFNNQSIAS